jgi:hypothetical protein
MNNISQLENSANKVNKIYGDLSYYDVYGGSVMLFFVLMIILFLVYSYTTVMKSVQPIKDNWLQERCNPKVIPFAGLINKPEGSSTIQFTQDNFNYCMQNVLTSITGFALEPLTFVTNGLNSLYQEITSSLNSMRVIISNIRTNIAKIAQEILGRVLNIMTPIQMILISFIDLIGKIKGIFAAAIYTSLGTYYTLKSLMGAILQFIVMLLMILAGLIVGLWIIPFTWPAAISGTAVFLSVSIPLLIIMVFMNQVLHVDINSPIPAIPAPGHCFDGDTLLLMKDGTHKPMKNIVVGDVLSKDGIVTSKLRLDSKNVDMYKLGNIIVSGGHRVYYENRWIFVREHPDVICIKNYENEYIYCINTNSKKIQIDLYEFLDWDELYGRELTNLLNRVKCDSPSAIHSYYNGGFYSNVMVEMNNGKRKEINKIKIGDLLKGGSKVIGLVQILGKNLGQNKDSFRKDGINVYPIFFYKDSNLEKYIGEKKWADNNGQDLYHLLTDKKSFYIVDEKYYDFNSCIDLYLKHIQIK